MFQSPAFVTHTLEIKSPYGSLSFSRVSFPYVACLEPSVPALQCSLPSISPLERKLPAEIQFCDNGEGFLFRNLHVKQEFLYVNRQTTCFGQDDTIEISLNRIRYHRDRRADKTISR